MNRSKPIDELDKGVYAQNIPLFGQRQSTYKALSAYALLYPSLGPSAPIPQLRL